MTRQMTDEELAGIAFQSLEGFSEMTRRYYNRVYFKALAVADNREVAEDITQETFFRVWLMRDKVSGKAISLQPWLAIIARNIAIDWQRKGQQRSRILQLIPMEEMPVEPESKQFESPRDAAASAEAMDQVNAALHSLPPEMREVIMLHYAEDMSPSDIARLNGEAVSTVTRRLERARQLVREQLESGLAAGIALMKPRNRSMERLLAGMAGLAALSTEAKAELLRLTSDTSAPILAESASAAAGSAGVIAGKAATGMTLGKWMLAAAVAAGGIVIGGVVAQRSISNSGVSEKAIPEVRSKTRITVMDSRSLETRTPSRKLSEGDAPAESTSADTRPNQTLIAADESTTKPQAEAIAGFVTVTGVVRDEETSEPLAGAEVYGMTIAKANDEFGMIFGGPDMRNLRAGEDAKKRTRVVADNAGRYELKVPLTSATASLALDAFVPGYRSLSGTFTSGGDFSKANIPVKLDDQLTHDLNLPNANYIAGRVVDEKGSGVANVEVKGTIHYKNQKGMAFISTEETDKDGWFEVFDYQTNPWYDTTTPSQKITFAGKLTFTLADRLTTSIEDIYLLDEAARANLTVVMEQGDTLSGRVVDAAGDPGTSLPIYIQYGPDNHYERRDVKSDAGGFFALKGLPDGEARICVRDMKRDIWENTTITIPAKGDLTLHLHATPDADESKPVHLMGMTLIDMTPELKAKYDQYSSAGVLILDPGNASGKFNQAAKDDIIGKGDVFILVGHKRVSNLREMAREILRVNAQPKPAGFIDEGYEGYVRIVYNIQVSRGNGSNTQYMNLTPDDIRELEKYLETHGQ